MSAPKNPGVRVRFAPSPTGHLHIGGVRTGLFNWLFARHAGGVFILRIEDTDRSRSTEDFIKGILEGLEWLGLDWDEGPYRQTDRLEVYRAEAERLFREGKAYACYCSAEELEARRAEAMKRGLPPKYDGRCRDRSRPVEGRKPAIRFASPQTGETVVNDLVKGRVVFENAQLDDLIVLRSDGTPTYNFCVVVDDVEMKISHVIRGDDHLNNTPRQVQLYQALGYPIPQFAHVSMILGADKARLSKRHGATATLVYRDMGYLPEALINYLARLGWSSGDQEIFSLPELIEKFDLSQLGKSAAVFNPEKLLWLNAHYIHHGDPGKLADRLLPFMRKEGVLSENEIPDEAVLHKIVSELKERSRTLVEMAQATGYFFNEKFPIDLAAAGKFLTPDILPILGDLASRLEAAREFSHAGIEEIFNEVLAERNLKLSKLAQPVRVALTGRTVSPGIFEVIEILGKTRTVNRLKKAVASIQSS